MSRPIDHERDARILAAYDAGVPVKMIASHPEYIRRALHRAGRAPHRYGRPEDPPLWWDQAVEMRRAGASHFKIAIECQTCRRSVRKALEAHGLT